MTNVIIGLFFLIAIILHSFLGRYSDNINDALTLTIFVTGTIYIMNSHNIIVIVLTVISSVVSLFNRQTYKHIIEQRRQLK